MAREQKVKTKASQVSKQEPVAGAKQTAQPVQTTKNGVAAQIKPNWPTWPTSIPGPRATPPPAGMHSFNPFRPEQVSEVGYDQEAGTPGTECTQRTILDEAETGPVNVDQQQSNLDPLKKRKQRL